VQTGMDALPAMRPGESDVKIVKLFCLLGLVVVSLQSCVIASDSKEMRILPAAAGICGITVGVTTVGDLAKRLGPGKICIGGHPYGGTVWRDKATGFVLRVDGFHYSYDGTEVIDRVCLTNWQYGNQVVGYPPDVAKKLAKISAPRVDLHLTGTGLLGQVLPGDSETQSVALLTAKYGTPKVTKSQYEWQFKGWVPYTDKEAFNEWWVTLHADKGKVAIVEVGCSTIDR